MGATGAAGSRNETAYAAVRFYHGLHLQYERRLGYTDHFVGEDYNAYVSAVGHGLE
jgi:hypothetical protein